MVKITCISNFNDHNYSIKILFINKTFDEQHKNTINKQK